jgi:hypothetical protein
MVRLDGREVVLRRGRERSVSVTAWAEAGAARDALVAELRWVLAAEGDPVDHPDNDGLFG